jgi:pyruvate kinase
MLSGETAVGQFPVESVAYMDRIAGAVEPSIDYRHQLPQADENPTVGQAMSNAACDLAEALRVRAMLVPTASGRTASAVARLRPHQPIIALTHHEDTVQKLAIEWGVTPILMPEARDVSDLWDRSVEAAHASGMIVGGDLVVITAGTAVNFPGTTNVIKVERVQAG